MRFLIILITIIIASSCTIVPPKITLTGEQTVIEKQIIGDYRELEADAWVVSTVRTNVQRESGTASGADKTRLLNLERINKYKSENAVGEGYDGMLKYRPVEMYEKNKKEKSELKRIIEIENNVRNGIIKDNAKAAKRNEAEETRIFADEQKKRAKPDELIETEKGKWVKK